MLQHFVELMYVYYKGIEDVAMWGLLDEVRDCLTGRCTVGFHPETATVAVKACHEPRKTPVKTVRCSV